MRDGSELQPDARVAPDAWLRAAAFGIVTALIGIIGHGAAAGSHVSVRFLIVAACVATVLARLDMQYRHGLHSLLLGLGLMQVALHTISVLTTSSDAPLAQAHGHVATGIPWTMLVVHGLAVALGAVILLALEAQVWELVTTHVAAVVRRVRRGDDERFDRARRRGGAVSLPPTTAAAWLPTPAQLRPALGLRGPPWACATH